MPWPITGGRRCTDCWPETAAGLLSSVVLAAPWCRRGNDFLDVCANMFCVVIVLTLNLPLCIQTWVISHLTVGQLCSLHHGFNFFHYYLKSKSLSEVQPFLIYFAVEVVHLKVYPDSAPHSYLCLLSAGTPFLNHLTMFLNGFSQNLERLLQKLLTAIKSIFFTYLFNYTPVWRSSSLLHSSTQGNLSVLAIPISSVVSCFSYYTLSCSALRRKDH